MYRQFKQQSAFTLIEVIIASMVLVIFFIGIYSIYSGVTKSVRRAQWSLSAQQMARTGLGFLREEMQRASDRVDISGMGKVIYTPKPMTLTVGDPVPDGTVAQWAICVPFTNGTSPRPGAEITCQVQLQGRKLVYTRTGGLTDDPDINGKVLVENVEAMTTSKVALDTTGSLIATGSLVTMKIKLQHPIRPEFQDTRVIEETAAKVEVQVN
ncbi:MAG: prepilin-type N-terminal cleavage/methylation domain-containing protein [Candidatus Ozemobacteraceae bacterium]